MKKYIDMWYRDDWATADKIDITFYPNSGEYRGNIYRNWKAIGDYTIFSSLDIEKTFSQLVFNWA